MLTSLVIEVEAKTDGLISGGTGRAIHGLWYAQWDQADPSTANMLHNETGTLPFSLSPLMGLPRAQKSVTRITTGQQAWFRIATLTRQLSERLTTFWAPQLPDEVELAGVQWRVVGVPQEHPWNQQISYQELAARHLFNNRPPEHWKFLFETPVTFNSGRGYLPFPLPNILIGSWMRRWQAFAPLALPDNLQKSVRERLMVSSYQMRSKTVRYGERIHLGGMGRYALRAAKMPASERSQVDLLANYAFFCGSGYKTTQGMGMTYIV
jgi:CRISPR-associated endoribonuclease Cas6